MSIYTKTGDYGTTSLEKVQKVSKGDERIQLIGNIDELTCNLGLIKASETRNDIKTEIERIQRNLMIIMAGISDQYNKEYRLQSEEVIHLEDIIDCMEKSFSRKKGFIIPGNNHQSAQIDVTRTIARRAERWLVIVDKKYTADQTAKEYMNRLADYLYIVARYTDYLYENNNDYNKENNKPCNTKEKSSMREKEIVKAVLAKLGVGLEKINLDIAKKMIEKIEEESLKVGLASVIAICGPDGNPIAVHVMDGALLASYDIAIKKAYTSVAVKMSTKELGKLAMPGQIFYGIDRADNGRMIIFGGGVPLKLDDKIIGGLGVSGGTSDQDTYLANFGLKILGDIWV